MSGSFLHAATIAFKNLNDNGIAMLVRYTMHDRAELANVLERLEDTRYDALVVYLRDPDAPFNDDDKEFITDLLERKVRGRPEGYGVTFKQLAMIAEHYEALTTRGDAKAVRAKIAEHFKVSTRTVNSWKAEYETLPPERRAEWFKGG